MNANTECAQANSVARIPKPMKIVTHPGPGMTNMTIPARTHDESEHADCDAPRELAAGPAANKRTDADEPSPHHADNLVLTALRRT